MTPIAASMRPNGQKRPIPRDPVAPENTKKNILQAAARSIYIGIPTGILCEARLNGLVAAPTEKAVAPAWAEPSPPTLPGVADPSLSTL